MVSGALGRPFFLPVDNEGGKENPAGDGSSRIKAPYIVRVAAALHIEVRVQPEKHGLQGTITNPSGRSIRRARLRK
jgi:hypothetical protein